MQQLSIPLKTNIGSVCVFLIIVLNRAVCLASVLGSPSCSCRKAAFSELTQKLTCRTLDHPAVLTEKMLHRWWWRWWGGWGGNINNRVVTCCLSAFSDATFLQSDLEKNVQPIPLGPPLRQPHTDTHTNTHTLLSCSAAFFVLLPLTAEIENLMHGGAVMKGENLLIYLKHKKRTKRTRAENKWNQILLCSSIEWVSENVGVSVLPLEAETRSAAPSAGALMIIQSMHI